MNRVVIAAIFSAIAVSGTARAHHHGHFHGHLFGCHHHFHPHVSIGWGWCYPRYRYVAYDPYYYYHPSYVYGAPRDYSATPYYEGRATPAEPRSGSAVPPPPRAASTGTSARIEVRVPDADAEVTFDGRKTSAVGHTRLLETPDLEPGESYSARVVARWQQDGRPIIDERKIDLTAGGSVVVDFTRPAPAERVAIPARTRLDPPRR
jgi:uncharacterized protein (TIGR03000 family)